MTGFHVTEHAVDRYLERFPTNLPPERARDSLQKMTRSARWIDTKRSGERRYRVGDLIMVVRQKTVVTVY